MSPGRRGLDDLLVDLAEAVDAAAELVGIGKERWDAERPLRLAGEAVVGRIGDMATKLPERLVTGTSGSSTGVARHLNYGSPVHPPPSHAG